MATMTDDNQYCAVRYKRLCKGKGRHVACQFPDFGPGSSCENYTYIKFTTELQHFILHYINRRRQRIAMGFERVRGGSHLPKPEIMTQVEWDRELAMLAQRLADQCHFVHDDCRATVRFPYAGQTVGEVRWRRSSDSEELSVQRAIRRVFDAWWGERRRVEAKYLTQPFKMATKGSVWGHFSQLAIWNLRAVGCGAVRHGAVHPRLLLVCDFSHTNMLGQRTIVPGPLAPCPIHTARRLRSTYPLLCALVRKPNPDDKEDQYADEKYDDESVDDDSYETEIPRSSLPMLWVRKSFDKTDAEDDVKKEDDELISLRANQKIQTKPAVMDKLQQELEVRNKVDKIKALKEQSLEVWTKRPPFGDWRINTEDVEIGMLRTSESSFTKKVDEAKVFFVPITKMIGNGHIMRSRWKQARGRLRRPGADALLTSTPNIVLKPLRRKPPISLMLDKDDVEQLFKDTGFRLSIRKNSIQRMG